MPDLHVIAAGSLLAFTLNDSKFRMPVGRVQSLYMKPCSFREFLMISHHQKLCDYLSGIHVHDQIEKPFHELLLEKLHEYFILGGMPEVIDYYLKHKDL